MNNICGDFKDTVMNKTGDFKNTCNERISEDFENTYIKRTDEDV